MANKNYFYVLVLTDHGAVFVTGTGAHHTAFWDCKKAPLHFSKTYAEEMAWGLRLNGHTAYMVTVPYELENQPYRYSEGNFYWKWDKENNKVVDNA